MKTLKGLLIWLLQACLMLLTFWLLTQLIWLGGAWYDVAAWALMPVLGLFSAYLVTRRGVNNYIAWLAPPVCAFFAHYIVTGYTPGGAGPTLACGTGASAAFAAGVHLGHLREKAEVLLPGGRLLFKFGKNGHVIVSGPAEISFFGELPEG